MTTEELFVSIIIIIVVAASILSEVFQRIGQPPLVGKLLAALLKRPEIFGLVLPSIDLHVLSNLAVFFLMVLVASRWIPRHQMCEQVSNSDFDHGLLHFTRMWHMCITSLWTYTCSVAIHGITLVNNCCTCESVSADAVWHSQQ